MYMTDLQIRTLCSYEPLGKADICTSSRSRCQPVQLRTDNALIGTMLCRRDADQVRECQLVNIDHGTFLQSANQVQDHVDMFVLPIGRGLQSV